MRACTLASILRHVLTIWRRITLFPADSVPCIAAAGYQEPIAKLGSTHVPYLTQPLQLEAASFPPCTTRLCTWGTEFYQRVQQGRKWLQGVAL